VRVRIQVLLSDLESQSAAGLPDGPLASFAFQEVGRPSARSVMASIVLHGLAITSLGFISAQAPAYIRNPANPIRTATTIRIGDRLYFVTRIPILPQPGEPSGPVKKAENKSSRKTPPAKPPQPEPPSLAEPALAEPALDAASSTPAPRVFVPPQVKPNLTSDSTLIQPLSPPDLVPEAVPLPSFRVRTAPLPPPDPSILVPGARTIADAPPPPQPTPDLNLHADPAPPETKAKLVLPPTPPPTVDPKTLRVYPPDAVSQLKLGDPVIVLSLSDRPVPSAEKLVIPPGNVVGKTGEELGPGVSATRGKSPVPDSKGSAAESTTAAPTPAQAKDVPGSRVILQPANGTFDAMVIQSFPVDQFPEARNLLAGKPVYTVYISVGSAKDWALYFCVPGENIPSAGETRMVRLGVGTPVQAPYPTRIERPDVPRPSYEKYILVHGFVTIAGRFENLRVVRPITAATDQAIVAALSGWQFRSATRDGVKVTVEFLLSIPVAGL